MQGLRVPSRDGLRRSFGRRGTGGVAAPSGRAFLPPPEARPQPDRAASRDGARAGLAGGCTGAPPPEHTAHQRPLPSPFQPHASQGLPTGAHPWARPAASRAAGPARRPAEPSRPAASRDQPRPSPPKATAGGGGTHTLRTGTAPTTPTGTRDTRHPSPRLAPPPRAAFYSIVYYFPRGGGGVEAPTNGKRRCPDGRRAAANGRRGRAPAVTRGSRA